MWLYCAKPLLNAVKMKTIENVTIYKCDFCKKELKRKHAMVEHEKWCGNNPENHRPCFNCKFFEQVKGDTLEIHYIAGGYDETRHEKQPDYFRCNKKDILIYTPNAEKKDLINRFPETFEDQEPMPKECELFSDDFSF